MKLHRLFLITCLPSVLILGCTTSTTAPEGTEVRANVLQIADARIPGIICSDSDSRSCMGVATKQECLSAINTYTNVCTKRITKSLANLSDTKGNLDKKDRFRMRGSYALCFFGQHLGATDYKRGTNKYCNDMFHGPKGRPDGKIIKYYRTQENLKSGITLYKNKDYVNALRFFRKVEVFYLDDLSIIKLVADVLFRTGDFPGAIEYYQRATKKEGYEHKSYLRIAASYLKLNDTLSAATYFNKILKVDNNDFSSLAYLGELYCKKKDVENCNKYMNTFEAKYKGKDLKAYSTEARIVIQGALRNFSIYRKRFRRNSL